ncbi:MAG: response regulator [Cyanobacteria bacterium J06621_8]
MSQQDSLILIVDDDRTMRSLLNLAMIEEGYRVVEAANGVQCLSEYTHFQPDLILLDAVMPDLDGFDCCQKIRSLPGGDRLPILMITVLDDQDSVEQAFQAGATDYITKPIQWSVLSQRVRRLLEISQAEAELSFIRQQFHQQQTWSDLISSILRHLAVGDRSTKLYQVLKLILQASQSVRVGLYQYDSQQYIESIAPGYPSIQDVFSPKVNFLNHYREQYKQESIIFIENILQAELSSGAKEQLGQLKTQSLAMIPLKTEAKILGWLQIHFSGLLPSAQLSPAGLLDLANLLTIYYLSND